MREDERTESVEERRGGGSEREKMRGRESVEERRGGGSG